MPSPSLIGTLLGMPELPEVETTRRGITPAVEGKWVRGAIVRESRLRWPVSPDLHERLSGQRCSAVERRAKYLLLRFKHGTLLIHLGMSGSLRVVSSDEPLAKHDHVDILLAGKRCLRYRDPRRFGAILWIAGAEPLDHKLLAKLGPEPLGESFGGDVLYTACQRRSAAIRNVLLDSKVVVGVGNIYASEACYLAGIRPTAPANKLSRKRCQRLAQTVCQVLQAAIEAGGTTLRDFQKADGKPGYFKQELHVYGREGEACHHCQGRIRREVLAARSLFYCKACQKS